MTDTNPTDEPDDAVDGSLILEDAEYEGLKYRSKALEPVNGVRRIVFSAHYWPRGAETSQLLGELTVSYDGVGIQGTDPNYTADLTEPIVKHANTKLLAVASELIRGER